MMVGSFRGGLYLITGLPVRLFHRNLILPKPNLFHFLGIVGAVRLCVNGFGLGVVCQTGKNDYVLSLSESDLLSNNINGIGLINSFLIFGIASVVLFLETHFLIPFLSQQTGIEPIVFWLVVAGLGLFLPLLIMAYLILKHEGLAISKNTWRTRLRFKKMNKAGWLWSLGAIILIGVFSSAIMKILEIAVGHVESQPPFMVFEPLTPDRYWILLLWFPYWLLNIFGEEILWRGVILPRQEVAFGKNAWLVHSLGWSLFHIAFGWKLLLTMLPILFIQSYVVQQRKNTWTGVVIHAVINGPSFIAISFGLL